jgi:hypothetical protein
MRVILQSWWQLQRTSSSFRYVNSGPAHIQCIYSSAYSVLDIRLNVSALLWEICRYLHERYTANLVPHTEHILRFTLCEPCSRTYTMYLHLRIFRLQCSSERISAAIGEISTIQCALYCKHGAKCSAHPTVNAIWTVVPDIYNVITAAHIQASIFIWISLRCYWRYADILMGVMLQIWCHILRTTTSLRYVDCCPDHIQSNYISVYLGFNIQLKVSALQLEISLQFNARYSEKLMPSIAHITQFSLWELWSRTYTM